MTAGNIVKILVAFPSGHAAPTFARVAVLDNTVHRVINPRRGGVATFHDLPAGSTEALVTIAGLKVARARIVVRLVRRICGWIFCLLDQLVRSREGIAFSA